jgi:hypothetical protein
VPVIVNAAFAGGFSLVVGGLILGISVPASRPCRSRSSSSVTAAACTGMGLMIAAIGFLVRETATLNNIVFGLAARLLRL